MCQKELINVGKSDRLTTHIIPQYLYVYKPKLPSVKQVTRKYGLTIKEWISYFEELPTGMHFKLCFSGIFNHTDIGKIRRDSNWRVLMLTYHIFWNVFHTRTHPCVRAISSKLQLGRQLSTSRSMFPWCRCHAGHCVEKVASARSNEEPAPMHPSNTYLRHHRLQPPTNWNDNNSHNNVYAAVIMAHRHSHCQSSPGSSDDCSSSSSSSSSSSRIFIRCSKTKVTKRQEPLDQADWLEPLDPPKLAAVVLHSRSPLITTQPESWYSFYHPWRVEGWVDLVAGHILSAVSHPSMY